MGMAGWDWCELVVRVHGWYAPYLLPRFSPPLDLLSVGDLSLPSLVPGIHIHPIHSMSTISHGSRRVPADAGEVPV